MGKKGVLRVWTYLIDGTAIFIVVEWLLRLLGISPIPAPIINIVDIILIVLLAVDFLYRLCVSPSKKFFLKESWLELLSLIPNIAIFRVFRMMRIIRKSRLRNFFLFVHNLLKTNSLYYVILVVILLAIITGGLLYRVEGSESIPSVADGVWLAFVTMTTVGYGDFVPLTSAGRLLSILLMVIGVGFLGVLTGSITAFFSRRRGVRKLEKRVDSLHPISQEEQVGFKVDLSDLSVEHREEVYRYISYLKHKDGSR